MSKPVVVLIYFYYFAIQINATNNKYTALISNGVCEISVYQNMTFLNGEKEERCSRVNTSEGYEKCACRTYRSFQPIFDSCSHFDVDDGDTSKEKSKISASSSSTSRQRISIRLPGSLYRIQFRFQRWRDVALRGIKGIGAQAPGPYHDIKATDGRTVIVHLFEWTWSAVADECERFLGPAGYAGVQISPPNEHAIVMSPYWNVKVKRPWYERYRPVSYRIVTRSGEEEQYADMVRRCNIAGVSYMDEQISSGGSYFDPKIPLYESVPYGPHHFNSRRKCGTRSGNIENFQDVCQLRNCRLLTLNDLDQSEEHVRVKMVGYMNHMIELGVAGFRIDAAKHMWPRDLHIIFDRLNNLTTEFFLPSTRPFIYQEVIDTGDDPISAGEYTRLGRVTEFNYGIVVGQVLLKQRGLKLSHLKTFGQRWGLLPSHHALAFVDNHDNQRGHGSGQQYHVLTFRDGQLYKMGVIFMLAWPYGVARIMSSYWWDQDIQEGQDQNDWVGPPHDTAWNISPPEINPDGTCTNGWICEHRWMEISNMVIFRNVVANEPVLNWWDNGNHQIAFSRGNSGFIVINNDSTDIDRTFFTGLPPGMYCDIISGKVTAAGCSGQTVEVNESGMSRIVVSVATNVPVVAIHLQAKLV
ncbi:alpha-amylase 1-like isoform X2 [Limulus polyphemus]|uniref:alpha-amylase n=1 Tax=Limulus polyphemus TaxID=6850 RepID=A0ABM1SY53_LIMPO|nr:alpha-amylase 1-like isoform X2 [Limulus polyphemus]